MKTILITILAVFSISNVLAQDSTDVKQSTFNFGVRLGTSIYDIKTDYGSSGYTGLYGALFVEKELSEKWSVQLEANLAGLDVLSFPILFKYNITEKFQVYGGAELNFSLGQKNVDERFGKNKKFGTSLILGTQYNINSRWFVEGRYTHGLSNQFPIYQGPDTSVLYGKRRMFTFGIGYKF